MFNHAPAASGQATIATAIRMLRIAKELIDICTEGYDQTSWRSPDVRKRARAGVRAVGQAIDLLETDHWSPVALAAYDNQIDVTRVGQVFSGAPGVPLDHVLVWIDAMAASHVIVSALNRHGVCSNATIRRVTAHLASGIVEVLSDRANVERVAVAIGATPDAISTLVVLVKEGWLLDDAIDAATACVAQMY